MSREHHRWVLVAAVLLGACSDGDAEPATPLDDAPVASRYELPPDGGRSMFGEQRPANLLPPSEAEARGYRRMNVDQLSAALERVTGQRWTEGEDSAEVELFERLSGSLGKPEYIDTTEEDLGPGLLFQKFLDDAAKSTCGRMIRADQAALPDQRRILVEVDVLKAPDEDMQATRRNLQRAILAFHGLTLPDDSPELSRWQTLLDRAHAVTKSTPNAWRAVCVGLITHPRFYSY